MTRCSRASQIMLALCICTAGVLYANSFTITSSKLRHRRLDNVNEPPCQTIFSTPFDLDMYDPSDDSELDPSSNPFQPENDDVYDASPLAVDPDTKLVLGINKYSHDTTLCAANIETGEVLFALSKERITRKKHDGGNTAELVEYCLDQLDLDIDAVVKVVMNNHHHRILPFIEKNALHMEWEEGLGINGGQEDGYSDEYNTLTSVEDKIELSHHLAHAYSAAAQCPFDEGMIVVMDGMGETFRTMKRAVELNDETYFSDFTLCAENGFDDIELVPSDIEVRAKTSYFDWREAESVYTFQKDKTKLVVKPIFKRFTEEKTPPTLYNHGFENMDSLGAVYSRASSHIFGDWNACGKVMGLAPWQGHIWNTVSPTGEPQQISSEMPKNHILKGSLYSELEIDKCSMMGLPFISRTDPDMFDDEGNMIRSKRYDFDDDHFEETESNDSKGGDEKDDDKQTKQLPLNVALDAIALASRVQSDLESVGIDFVRHFKNRTGQTNLCLAGGVALNSVLNGRLSRELGFRNTFIPPYPGDDGIAVGCCAFGLFGKRCSTASTIDSSVVPMWKEPLSPYLGPLYTDASMKEAISWAAPWLDVQTVPSETDRIDLIVNEIASSGVVALYTDRSELGPRALGHRSILADPRKKGLVRFINEFVKKRESFRPFAPSALAEEASQWFDLGEYASEASNNVSPYMSITAQVIESKKKMIPAVTHVDGSSRLQTVTSEAEPFYHRLISAFYKATGVPMVLNTSFNTLKSEPIVESPRNAIRSFLSSMGSIEMLVMGNHVIKRKEANVRKLLGEEQKSGLMTPPSFPVRSGTANYKTTFSAENSSGNGSDSISDTVTLVQIPDRPMHNEMDGGWFELLDDLEGQLLGMCDGSNGVNDIISYFSAISEQEGQEGTQQSDKFTEHDQLLVENILMRLVRLYDHTMISW